MNDGRHPDLSDPHAEAIQRATSPAPHTCGIEHERACEGCAAMQDRWREAERRRVTEERQRIFAEGVEHERARCLQLFSDMVSVMRLSDGDAEHLSVLHNRLKGGG